MQSSGCWGSDVLQPDRFCGGHSERETPVPIPNTAVKTLSADDTTGATPWESRKPPRFLLDQPRLSELRETFKNLENVLKVGEPKRRKVVYT